ncbi:uncharacterized protein LOC121900407 [Thunnus maccoyii]|uniref:uncharacterized protein LOC121900407 n=1 Tax=Thunnus maccoyii TaxID=8240 RepID=UPI001C4B38F9|nr:uncharacterized protein LOC121900407 [Thunnus maccoyii]
MHTHMHTLIDDAIAQLEKKQETANTQHVGTYAKYSTDAYAGMPTHTLLVHGKHVTFLVDSGATQSVIRADTFLTPPKMSGRYMKSVGASGDTVLEKYRFPLSCTDDVTGKFKHSLLLSNCCPINLMGRDVMCFLGICLVSTSKGVIVIRTSELEFPDTHVFVKYSPDTLLYVYERKLCTSAVTSVNTADVESSCTLTFNIDTDYMQPQDLHCTAHIHEGGDAEFEKRWFKDGCLSEKLTLSNMFWNKHRYAVSVTLPEQTKPKQIDESSPYFSFSDSGSNSLFDIPVSYPHVSNTGKENGKIWVHG